MAVTGREQFQTHFHYRASMNFSNTRLHEKFISDLDVYTTVQFLLYKTLGDLYISLTSENSNGESLNSFILISIQAHFFFFLLDISQWLDNLHFKLDLIFDILLDKEEKEAKLIISETRLENCVLYVFHFTKESTRNNFF